MRRIWTRIRSPTSCPYAAVVPAVVRPQGRGYLPLDIVDDVPAVAKTGERVGHARFFEPLVEFGQLLAAAGELLRPLGNLLLEPARILGFPGQPSLVPLRVVVRGAGEQEAVERVGPPGPPRWRNDLDGDGYSGVVPDPLVVGPLYSEDVIAWIEVGEADPAELAEVDPVPIEAFQLVGVSVRLGRGVVEGGELE
jgi:hypothetical protein